MTRKISTMGPVIALLALLFSIQPALAVNWIDNCREQSPSAAGKWFGTCPPYYNDENNWENNQLPGPTDNALIGAEYGLVEVNGYPSEATILSVDAQGGLEISHSSYGLVLTSGGSSINGLQLFGAGINASAGVTLNLLGNSYLNGSFYGPGSLVNSESLNVNYGRIWNGASLFNPGVMNLTHSYFMLGDGNTVVMNTGIFNISETSTDVRGGSSLFVNNGTIFHDRPNFTFYFSPNYEQSGNLSIVDGTFLLNSLTTSFNSGEVSVGADAILELSSNQGGDQSHSFGDGFSLSGQGQVINHQNYFVDGQLNVNLGSGDPASGSGGFFHYGAFNALIGQIKNSGRFCFRGGSIHSEVSGENFINEPSGWVYTSNPQSGAIGCSFENFGQFQLGGGSISIMENSGQIVNHNTFRILEGHINGLGYFSNLGYFSLEHINPTGYSNVYAEFYPDINGLVHSVSGYLYFINQIVGLDENGKLSRGYWKANLGAKIVFPRIVTEISGNTRLDGQSSSFPNVDLVSVVENAMLKSKNWENLTNLINDGGKIRAQAGGSGIRVNGTLTNSEGGSIEVESGAQLNADQLDNGNDSESVVSELASYGVGLKSNNQKAIGEPATVITPLLNNHAIIAPGGQGEKGALHLVGNLVQHSTGILDVDVYGAEPDSMHDRFTIEGNASLNGIVKVRLQTQDWPTPGQEFIILSTTGTIAGAFSGIDQPLGSTFSLRHEANQVVLVTEDVNGPTPVPELNHGFKLAAAYPNPFNPSTTIAFNLPQELPVTLRIYDISGRLVRELIQEGIHTQGLGQVSWNGRNDSGGLAPAGVYFYKLDAGQYTATKRMTLIK
ncbi:MAG: T9SS type A sorting domain-containing protein [bacterium]|nr:T9SS type A sorting domain-containing protein [bacterium]